MERPAYLQRQPAWVFPLPESVDHMHLDETTNVLVKGGHEKVYVMEVVELPAFCDQRVAQDILEGDRVLVHLWRQIPDPGKLKRRLEHPRRH
jgi:hypothetical protein